MWVGGWEWVGVFFHMGLPGPQLVVLSSVLWSHLGRCMISTQRSSRTALRGATGRSLRSSTHGSYVFLFRGKHFLGGAILKFLYWFFAFVWGREAQGRGPEDARKKPDEE